MFLQVIKAACQGNGSNIAGVPQNSPASKELHYVLRVLGPAACRCPDIFTEVAKRCLRVELPPTMGRVGE